MNSMVAILPYLNETILIGMKINPMKHLFSILIFLSFMSVTFAEDNARDTLMDLFIDDKSEDNRILAKEDADWMFSNSLDKWNANVLNAVAAGISKTFMEEEFLPTGLPMLTIGGPVGDGMILTVTPMYSENSLDEIYVDSVNTKWEETDQAVIDTIFNSAVDEMQPEYNVETYLLYKEGNQVFRFVISR